MKIEIRLIGRLTEYWESGKLLDIAEGATISESLEAIGLPDGEAGMISVNGASIPRKSRESQKLAEGDSITIMAPVHGG